MDLLRHISDREADVLPPGAPHYRSFVGAPNQYDLRGGAQFALLFALGLRERHRLLDFGCGSLRFGRLVIPYLQAGGYVGLEPNTWLVDDGIARQVGHDQVAIKRPTFYSFDDFQADRCGTGFDFIVAQSVFSHVGRKIIQAALPSFRRALAPDGLALVTFALAPAGKQPDDDNVGWVYPGGVRYRPETIDALIEEAGLAGRRLPWFHPAQTWYALSRSPDRLPPPEFDVFLRGAVLNTPPWAASTHSPID